MEYMTDNEQACNAAENSTAQSIESTLLTAIGLSSMIRLQIKVLIPLALVPLMASATSYFDNNAPPSLADYIPSTRSKNLVEYNWLPELTGLPNNYQVTLLTQHMVDVMMKEQDTKCTSISLNLRMMIFQHFVIYQQMVNAQHVYLDEQIAHQWAHVLAMILKESSGDSSNITDMCGYSISTDDSKTNLQQWRQILKLSSQSQVELNYQTNFGLTQTSADRMMDAFRLTKDQSYDMAFLEGKEGASMPGKPILNTAIAIRRLIWFYQGFAQGRISESDKPFTQQSISNPALSTRYNEALTMALLYCGTQYMFGKASQKNDGNNASNLQNAMASIAYCKLGNQQTGYGTNQADEQCFAEWVTLCPALNVDIAILTPLSYFATRGQKPVCEDTFKRLLNKKPMKKQIERQLPLPEFEVDLPI